MSAIQEELSSIAPSPPSILPSLPSIVGSPKLEIVQTPQEKSLSNWKKITDHLTKWYHAPDFEALEISLAVALSHRIKKDKPVWLFVIGPSGSGKTAIIVPAVTAFMDVTQLSDITPQSFLSGLSKSKGGESLLMNIGTKEDRSGCFLFSDFTTLLSKDPKQFREIAAKLREIYDGHTRKDFGSRKPLEWRGKITTIACCTPKLERAWGAMRDMGERFLQVRWNRSDGIQQAIKATEQLSSGMDRDIEPKTTELVNTFLMDTPLPIPEVTLDPIENGVAHLAEITALLRGHVVHEQHGRSRDITDIDEPEGNTRIMKGLVQIARCRAALQRREMILEDYQVSARVAIDSIPAPRFAVISKIPMDGIRKEDLLDTRVKPKTTMLRVIEELCSMGILEEDDGEADKYITLTPKFRELREKSAHLIAKRL